MFWYTEYRFLITGPDGVNDSQLTASSTYNTTIYRVAPKYARLNVMYQTSWCAFDLPDDDDFVQVQSCALLNAEKTCPERLAPPYGVVHSSTQVHRFSTRFLYLTVL